MAIVSSSIDALEEQQLDKVNLGQHVLAEFFECDSNVLNSLDKVEKHMVDAALECGATIVQKCFHMFNPYGVSGVVIISESHLAIHTWPELGYAAVDLFTCGTKCDPKVAYEFLKKMFNSKKASFTELKIQSAEKSSVMILMVHGVHHSDTVSFFNYGSITLAQLITPAIFVLDSLYSVKHTFLMLPHGTQSAPIHFVIWNTSVLKLVYKVVGVDVFTSQIGRAHV